ncbi:MAG: hypothetical protein Fur0022_20080 [Anaerolineales bacterium]
MSAFLLQPDVAYLFLVGGFLMVLMAILTPGTGVFEIGAGFVLLIAAWQVYNLPFNAWALGVLFLSLLPFWLAVRKSGALIYLILSIAGLVVGSVFLFQGEGWRPAVNPILAFVVSSLTGGFLWLAARKTLEAQLRTPTHDLGGLVGTTGIARTDIHQEGAVFIHNEDWSAQSEQPIPAGTEVRVIRREGFVLWVEPVERSQSMAR